MKRVALLTAVLTLAGSGAALALSYSPGTYKSGAPAKNPKTHHNYLKLKVKNGRFAVNAVWFVWDCIRPEGIYRGEFGWESGPGDKLAGKIDRKGRFSARWFQGGTDADPYNYTLTVAGRVKGKRAKVRAQIIAPPSTTNPPDEPIPCSGTQTFRAKRVSR
jgi:hypothetical protein